MKVWVTKYALETPTFAFSRHGLYEAEVEAPSEHGFAAVLSDPFPKRDSRDIRRDVIQRGDWHTTREEAVAKVKKMIRNRKAAIRKELRRLDALMESLREVKPR